MKKLLLGLLALGSFSAFAETLSCSFSYGSDLKKNWNKEISAEDIKGEFRDSLTSKDGHFEIHVIWQDRPSHDLGITIIDHKKKTEMLSTAGFELLRVRQIDNNDNYSYQGHLEGSCQIGSVGDGVGI